MDERSQPGPRAVLRLMGLSALLGVIVALFFQAFEWSSRKVQHWLWSTVPGEHPAVWYTITLATVGGLLVGLAIRFLPGHGGAHPADGHGMVDAAHDASPPRFTYILAAVFVGWLGLVAGASLGPEGALFPAVIGLSVLMTRRGRVAEQMQPLAVGAGIGAVLAAMLGNPLAGVVPLLELIPTTTSFATTMMVLPSLVAASVSVLTLRLIGAHSLVGMGLDYVGFRPIHVVWVVLVAVVAGAAGLIVDRATAVLRRFTLRVDARSLVLTGGLGGLVLGLLYAIGGVDVRFSGMPELVHLISDTQHARGALLALSVKAAATAWCLAAGYRGGKIFPVVFVGGATGLALHLLIHRIPLGLAVGVGLAAAMATALAAPVMAAMLTASLVGPTLVPFAIIGVVVAHVVHLLAGQVAAQGAAPTAPAPAPTTGGGSPN
jgi:H+/Cl- antiporter ClcA